MIQKILFFLLFQLSLQAHNLKIDSIPDAEQKILEDFFRYLICDTVVGYSLCGNKPIAVEDYACLCQLPPEFTLRVITEPPDYSLFPRAWEIWSRHKDKVISSRFIMRYSNEYNTLIFINLEATRKTIDDNLDIFKKYFASADEAMLRICLAPDREYLYDQTTLLGLLLGFGRNNAIAFKHHYGVKKLKCFELEKGDLGLNLITNPGFMIIDDGTNEKENQRVYQNFRDAKKNITKNFREGNYLTKFLELYTAS